MTDFFNDARTHAGRPELPPSPQHSGASSQTIPYEEWNTDIVPWSELEDVCSTFNFKGKKPIIIEDDEQEEEGENEEEGSDADGSGSYDDQDGASLDSVAQGRKDKRKDDDSDIDYSET